ncbi:hypothetical protein Plec18167_002334 [Paecilomyces lecythidis]|uniref:Aminoglycoside phosphotransferase domain-containing protein n=1 Tax=Paecilomyces lecythidis TaxID=3004212 RepID=A0ABR3YAA9_9EURO
MELIDGDTLQERWPSLSNIDRVRLCEELRQIVTSLRRLEQSPDESFIGRVGGQPISDATFSGTEAGPFPTVKDFNEWFSALPKQGLSNTDYDDPFRSGLADDVPIRLTHSDLHPSNIMITSNGTPHVVALVDFHQSGWLPAYLEYSKALLTCPIGGEWETLYIPMFLEPYPECFKSYSYYAGALGC